MKLKKFANLGPHVWSGSPQERPVPWIRHWRKRPTIFYHSYNNAVVDPELPRGVPNNKKGEGWCQDIIWPDFLKNCTTKKENWAENFFHVDPPLQCIVLISHLG